ncbi:hypothetical protein SAMN02745133_02201 [Desulforamulus putei DSM 12395]|uniref:Uncharacterized protein n=1 Tax=Desulforamulus putei DSM 12395 TaxID=1121429 RepID=A0A1M5A7P9_9FIRM|nr:hypothetical protein SAMN02745133_02201 [Desulforamulus putei DSM 12395]
MSTMDVYLVTRIDGLTTRVVAKSHEQAKCLAAKKWGLKAG